jgi:hypothetical protein
MQTPQTTSAEPVHSIELQQSSCERQERGACFDCTSHEICVGEQVRQPSRVMQKPSLHSASEPQLVSSRQSLTQSVPSGPDMKPSGQLSDGGDVVAGAAQASPRNMIAMYLRQRMP